MTVLCGSCHRIKGFHFLVNESRSRGLGARRIPRLAIGRVHEGDLKIP